MNIEHFFYSAAFAVIVGMVFSRSTGRDPSWIVFAMVYFPDLYGLFNDRQIAGIPVPGMTLVKFFHTAFMLLAGAILSAILITFVISGLIAVFWKGYRIRFSDALICSALGIFMHLFSDALVYMSQYQYLWPLYDQPVGIGALNPAYDFFNVANSTILGVGIAFLIGALVLRTSVEGPGWWGVFIRLGSDDKTADKTASAG